MRNQIETPPEVRKFHAQQWRSHRWSAWRSVSLVTLLCAVGLLGVFRLRGFYPPAGLVAAFLAVPLVLPGLMFLPMPFLASLPWYPWQWDDHGVAINGRLYPWRVFKGFQIERGCLTGVSGRIVQPGATVLVDLPLRLADYTVFRLKFHDRLLNPGRWVSISARTADAEDLAACAAKHLGVSASP